MHVKLFYFYFIGLLHMERPRVALGEPRGTAFPRLCECARLGGAFKDRGIQLL